ncbi:MAG: ATP-binding protein [Bacillota bacterium]
MFNSIRRRLIYYYLVVISVIVILIGGFLIWFVNYYYMNNLRENLYNQATLAASLIEEMLERGAGSEEIDSLCKEVGEKLEVRITLVDASGTVLGDSAEDPKEMDDHSDRPEIIEALRKDLGVASRYSDTLDNEMYYLAIPLDPQFSTDSDHNSVPVVRLALPLEGIRTTLTNLVLFMIGALLVSSGFALIAALVFSAKITGPIGKISGAAREIAAGNFVPQLKVSGRDELALLAENIKEMGLSLRNKMEQILWEKNKLETVVSSMSSGIILADHRLNIEMINQAAEKLLDISHQDVKGRPLQNVVRYNLLHANLKSALAEGKPRMIELNIYYPHSLILETYILPVTGAENEVIGVLILFHEVTHLRSIEKMRSDFVANVSHELRTPLTNVRGYMETIMHERLSREQLIEFLKVIDQETRRLTGLVDDLLDLARIENEKGFVKKEAVNLKEMINEALARVEELCAEKEITIEFSGSPENILVAGNHDWLCQAVVNILENSIKHGGPGSSVKIAVASKDNTVVVEIEDNGPGIPEKDLPYIFERFYRVDKARSRKSGGTGLGLSIVKHIMEAHGASYTLDSTEGKGSVFRFTLFTEPGDQS